MLKSTDNKTSQLSIFRDADHFTTLEQSQLNTSSASMYPSIQHATLLEDSIILLNELNEGSNKSPTRGKEHDYLYENDKIDNILDSAFFCCYQLDDTNRDYEVTTAAESQYRKESQVNCCDSPTAPSPVSVTFQNPPALPKTNTIQVGKDAAPPSFLPIPANHVPLRSQHHENNGKLKMISNMSSTRSHDVMRLCKRQVMSRIRISPRASRSWVSSPTTDVNLSLPALNELQSTIIVDKMMISQLSIPLL